MRLDPHSMHSNPVWHGLADNQIFTSLAKAYWIFQFLLIWLQDSDLSSMIFFVWYPWEISVRISTCTTFLINFIAKLPKFEWQSNCAHHNFTKNSISLWSTPLQKCIRMACAGTPWIKFKYFISCKIYITRYWCKVPL